MYIIDTTSYLCTITKKLKARRERFQELLFCRVMVQIVTAIFGNGIMGSKLESIISSSLWKANTMEHKENMYFWKKKGKRKEKACFKGDNRYNLCLTVSQKRITQMTLSY